MKKIILGFVTGSIITYIITDRIYKEIIFLSY